MDRFDTSTMEAMLVEATAAGAPSMSAALASHDELEAIMGGDENPAQPPKPPPPTQTATERCHRTCGGCRG